MGQRSLSPTDGLFWLKGSISDGRGWTAGAGSPVVGGERVFLAALQAGQLRSYGIVR